MWREIQDAQDPAHGNLVGGGFLRPGYSVDQLLRGLADLLGRHESLRSTFHSDFDGRLSQRVTDRGELAVELHELDGEPAATVGKWINELEAAPYDLGSGLPFRARIGTTNGEPALVMFGAPHLACDFLGCRVLFDELLRGLEGLPPRGPSGLQPAAQAAWERSEAGHDVLRRSLEYWRRVMMSGPQSGLGAPRYPPEAPRYWRGGIRSRAVVQALDRLAARYQVGTSHVLMAAMATLVGRYTGRDRFLVRVVAGNRGLPELRNAVGTLSQEVVANVHVTTGQFSEAARSAWSASLAAMRYGRYDPDLAAGIVDEAEVELDIYFNDMWTATRDGRGSPLAGVDPPPAGPECSEETTFAWEEHLERADVAFFLEAFEVYDDPAAVHLSLLVDTTRIPSPTLRTFLFAFEELLSWLADDDSVTSVKPNELELRHDPGVAARMP